VSDASKRRGDDLVEELVPKRVFTAEFPYQMEGPPQPTRVGMTPRGKPIYLPQDVANIQTWGRSVIQFGKYMKKRDQAEISYCELFEAVHDEEKARYLKWLISQTDTPKGHLLDLASYICVRSAEVQGEDQLPFIPGTSTLRIVK
jgi:hypothetical protein